MRIFSRIKRTGLRVAVKIVTGTAAAGILGDWLVRMGLPEGTADQVGDGILALVAYILAGGQ